VNVCLMGKEKRASGNVTCRSCQAQAVTCPFPCLPGGAPVKSEISSPEAKPAKAKKKKQPNKTEREYMHRVALEYPGAKVRYEPITLHLDNGHAYTPDIGVFMLTGEILLIEVKGVGKNGFKHPSYQRARCMFDQSRIEFPFWKWRWAERRGTTWTVTE